MPDSRKPIYSPIRRAPSDAKLLPGQPDYLIVRPLRDDAVEVIHPKAPDQKIFATNPEKLWHIFTHPEYYFTQADYGVAVNLPDPPRDNPRPRYVMNDQGTIVRVAHTGKTQRKAAREARQEKLGDAAEF